MKNILTKLLKDIEVNNLENRDVVNHPEIDKSFVMNEEVNGKKLFNKVT
jgi:hypothetical protein